MQRNSDAKIGYALNGNGEAKKGLAQRSNGIARQGKALKCEGKAWPRKRGLDMQKKSMA